MKCLTDNLEVSHESNGTLTEYSLNISVDADDLRNRTPNYWYQLLATRDSNPVPMFVNGYYFYFKVSPGDKIYFSPEAVLLLGWKNINPVDINLSDVTTTQHAGFSTEVKRGRKWFVVTWTSTFPRITPDSDGKYTFNYSSNGATTPGKFYFPAFAYESFFIFNGAKTIFLKALGLFWHASPTIAHFLQGWSMWIALDSSRSLFAPMPHRTNLFDSAIRNANVHLVSKNTNGFPWYMPSSSEDWVHPYLWPKENLAGIEVRTPSPPPCRHLVTTPSVHLNLIALFPPVCI